MLRSSVWTGLGWTGVLIDLDEVVSYQNCCAATLRHRDLKILGNIKPR